MGDPFALKPTGAETDRRGSVGLAYLPDLGMPA
jgi:hypothetical protein